MENVIIKIIALLENFMKSLPLHVMAVVQAVCTATQREQELVIKGVHVYLATYTTKRLSPASNVTPIVQLV
jgi:hypothetical protein